jgi:hypothetical protein
MRTYWEWSYSSTILDLDTRWRWVVSFMPRPFYPKGNRIRYPSNRGRVGLQSRSGPGREQKISWPCQEWNPDSSVVQPVSIPTELFCSSVLYRLVLIFILKPALSSRLKMWCKPPTARSILGSSWSLCSSNFFLVHTEGLRPFPNYLSNEGILSSFVGQQSPSCLYAPRTSLIPATLYVVKVRIKHWLHY